MSFNNLNKVLGGIQEALVFALMLVFMFAVLYFDLSMVYKISIGVIVFTVIFLTTLATSILRQQKQARQQAASA